MTAKRKHIPDRVKLAACLLSILRVPPELAAAMCVEQILALVQWDHYPISHADGGPDEPWNLQPMPVKAHLAKTGIDAGIRAKTKRIAAARAAHSAKMAAKLDPPPIPRITRPLFKDMKRKIRHRISPMKNRKQCLHCKKDFELTIELIALKCNCYCDVACRDAHKATRGFAKVKGSMVTPTIEQ